MAHAWWLLGATLLGIGAAGAAENPLARYRWSARVLVISAPGADDARLAAQRAVLAQAGPGLKTRDLVVLEALGGTRAATALRTHLGLPGSAFRAVLVGKDGEIKRTETAPLAAQALFETIDAMPMRRDEMRR